MSNLVFRYGSMNSGKSTHLIQTVHNHRQLGVFILVCKPKADTKGGGYIISRAGSRVKSDCLITPTTDFLKLVQEMSTSDRGLPHAIVLDEVQFLEPVQIKQLRLLTVKYNVPVICYGLKSDFRDEIFPASEQLLAVADDIIKFDTALCSICKERIATINARYNTSTKEYTRVGDAILVDDESTIGSIQYLPVCSHCYYTKFEKDLLKDIYE